MRVLFVLFILAVRSSAAASDPLAPAALSPLRPSVLILESQSAPPEHRAWLQALLLEQAPQAQVSVRTAGEDLAGLRTALREALAQRPQLILFGFGHEGFDRSTHRLLQQLWQAGAVLVAPAGNGGAGHSHALYPASYPFVLGVGSAGAADEPASHATFNFGVKLLGPGQDVAAPAGSGLQGPVSGSSYAAASVAGMAARLLSEGRDARSVERSLKRGGRGDNGPRRASTARARTPFQAKAPAARPWAGVERGGQALLQARPGKAAALRARLLEQGGRSRFDFGEQGLIAELSAAQEAALQADGLLQSAHRSALSAAQLAALPPARARVGRLWNNAAQGQRAGRLPAPDYPSGAPLLGCADFISPAARTAPLQPQGLYIPSPPTDGAIWWATSSYMAGRIAVSIVLPQANGVSDTVRSTWTQGQIDNVLAEIANGANWMDAQNPSAKIEWVFDIHAPVPNDYEPILHPSSEINGIIENSLDRIGPSDILNFITARRTALNADWALLAFVVNDTGCPECNGAFPDGRFAFTYLGGPRLVMTYNNDGWGISRMDKVFVHEASHDFGALDEYPGGQPASFTCGYYNAPNDNASSGGTLNDPYCPMRGWADLATGHYCAATRLHVGWRDLDNDGVLDVLDTQMAQTWNINQPSTAPLGGAVRLTFSAQELPEASLHPYIYSVSINAIESAQYRLNGGPWWSTTPVPGSTRSLRAFAFNTGPLTGDTLVEVRSINSAGNSSTAYLSRLITVPTATVTPTVSPSPSHSPTMDLVSTATPDWSATATPSFTPSASATVSVTPYSYPCWQLQNTYSQIGNAPGDISWPRGVTMDQDRVYVADDNNDRISIFDRATGQFVTTFGSTGNGPGQFWHPHGVAVNATRIFVADAWQDRIQVFDKSSFAHLATFGTGQLNFPTQLQVDDTYLYVASGANHRLVIYEKDPPYAYAGFVNSISGVDYNFGVALSEDRIFLSESGAHRIEIYDRQSLAHLGGWVPHPGYHVNNLSYHKGFLYSAHSTYGAANPGTIRVHNVQGGAISLVASISGPPLPFHGVVVDDQGMALVSQDSQVRYYVPCSGYQSPTHTPSGTPSSSPSPSESATRTVSATPSPSFTASPSPTPHACGQVTTVCFFGCDSDDLAAAIAQACAGDTVQVKGGQWIVPGLALDKDLHLEGLPGQTLDGDVQLKPVLYGLGMQPILHVGGGAPRSVTLTNLAFNSLSGGALVSVSQVAGSHLRVERVEFKRSVTGTGAGLALSAGLGSLVIRNAGFIGFEAPSLGAIHVDTSAGFGGSADIQHNTFLSASPAAYVRLSVTASYGLLLSGNLFYNRGPQGLNGLYLAGDPLAGGDRNAWYGYSGFYGGMTPGPNDFPNHNASLWAPGDDDLRYSSTDALAWSGSLGYGAVDFYGDTRPAAGQSSWSVGAAEPVTATYTRTASPSHTPTVTPTVTPTATQTATPTVTLTDSPTATDTPTATITPSVTPTFSITVTFSASPTATLSFTPFVYGCEVRAGNTSGSSSTGMSSFNFYSSYPVVIPGSIHYIDYFSSSAGLTVSVAAFDDNGGVPGNLLVQSADVVLGAGLQRIPVPDTLVSGPTVWLALRVPGSPLGSLSLRGGGPLRYGGAVPFANNPGTLVYLSGFSLRIAAGFCFATHTPTSSPTFSDTPTITATPTSTATPTDSPVVSATPTSTDTPDVSATPTSTASPTRTVTVTVTPTWAACAGETSMGTTISGASSYSYFMATRFTLASAGDLTAMQVRMAVGGRVRLGIYDGVSQPVTRLVQSAEHIGVPGWNTVSMSGLTLAAGTYWLATLSENTAGVHYCCSGTGFYNFPGYGSMPAIVGAGTSFSWTHSVRALFCPIVPPTATPTFTDSPTASPTPTSTASPSDTPTASPTPTSTVSPSDTPTASPTSTHSPSPTDSPTPSVTMTATPTRTDSPTPSQTASFTVSPTSTPGAVLSLLSVVLAPSSLCGSSAFTVIFTVRNDGGGGASNVSVQSLTQTGTADTASLGSLAPSSVSLAGGASAQFTLTGNAVAGGTGAGPWGLALAGQPVGDDDSTGQPLAGASLSSNQAQVCAYTPTATLTVTGTSTPTPTATPSASPSATGTVTPADTPTSTATGTPTPSVTLTASPSPTVTSADSATHTPTLTATSSITHTATPSSSGTPSTTPSPTGTPSITLTPSPTGTPSWTASPTPSRTHSATLTVSPSPTGTPSITLTPSPTGTPSWTASPTPSRTHSATRTVSPSATPTPVLTATPTATISPTFTAVVATPTPVVAKDLLAPVPLRAGQPLRLYFRGAAGPSQWRVYNVAGELVAKLSFGPGEDPAWQRAGLAGGIYFAYIEIEAPTGKRSFWQRLALL